MPTSRNFWARPLAPLRYAAVWAFYLLMRGLVVLPWRWQIRLCSLGGDVARLVAPGRRRVVEINLNLCFPELDDVARRRLAREHFRALGASIAEMAMGWFGRPERVRALVEIEGLEHIDAALERGRGVILYSGHFTSFEVFFPELRAHCKRLSGMYKDQRNPLMNKIMTAGRLRNVDRLFSKDEVRGMLRELASNSVFWYAADQSYGSKGAALIPFFGEPAMTNTAISRIAKVSGAPVLPYFPRRLPGWQGYKLTIGPSFEDFPTDDPVADTRRLVNSLEAFARESPDQYWWIHKRFKGRPAPLPDVYARRSIPSA
jgi:KDO2-lipid IV(A) lauroyltransferase